MIRHIRRFCLVTSAVVWAPALKKTCRIGPTGHMKLQQPIVYAHSAPDSNKRNHILFSVQLIM